MLPHSPYRALETKSHSLLLAACGAGVVLSLAGPTRAQCGDPATPLHEVQGAGEQSPLSGNEVTIEAVVVADTQGASGLGGFFVQEEDADADLDPATSEGLFVVAGAESEAVSSGDLVRVAGFVEERYELTALRADTLVVCAHGRAVTPADVMLPVASVGELERFEGMSVRLRGPLVVTNSFDLARYGELDLAFDERLYQPTEMAAPGAAARERQTQNELARIQLDDGRSVAPERPPYLAEDGTVRAGDTLSSLQGVLGFGYGRYEVHPTQAVRFARANPRPETAPDVGGTLRVASFNLGNYFVTLDDGRPQCGPRRDLECRGARSAAELALQRSKLLATLAGLNADILALAELENGGAALEDLKTGLNELAQADVFEAIATGSVGGDAIQVGLLYRSAVVTPVGDFALLDARVDPRFDDDFNRPVLAQTFATTSGERLTVAVNHLKSKGSDCARVGDPDTLDGQGVCNRTRLDAVTAEREWLLSDPTSSGDPDFLVVGDLNAYTEEDPVRALLDGGLVELTAEAAYSYCFDGQFGALDHALASAELALQTVAATTWHINADEPAFLDYRGTPSGEPTPFRSSDHDPLLVGLALGGENAAQGSAPSRRPAPSRHAVPSGGAAASERGRRVETGSVDAPRKETPAAPSPGECHADPARRGPTAPWEGLFILACVASARRAKRAAH